MCLALVLVSGHPYYPLLVASNRDEFLKRPSVPLHCWSSIHDAAAGDVDAASNSGALAGPRGRLILAGDVRRPSCTDPDLAAGDIFMASAVTAGARAPNPSLLHTTHIAPCRENSPGHAVPTNVCLFLIMNLSAFA